MIFLFWFLALALGLWYLGALGFIYHIFSFRYPRDITIQMLIIFLLFVVPISLAIASYLADFYGGIV